jgi:uncharacterized RDD family membrane protein YckC
MTPVPERSTPARSRPPGGRVRPGQTNGREQYAGIVSRLLALAVDAAVLAIAIPAIGAGAPALWGSIAGSTPRWLHVCAAVLAGLLPFAYFWLGWWSSGRTLGGALLGAEVRRTDCSRLGAIRAAARAFLGLVFAPVWLACMALIAFDPRRRALHDVVFRTVVVRTVVRRTGA